MSSSVIGCVNCMIVIRESMQRTVGTDCGSLEQIAKMIFRFNHCCKAKSLAN